MRNRVEIMHGGAGEEDRMLDLGPGDFAALAHRGVGPDIAVGQTGAGADVTFVNGADQVGIADTQVLQAAPLRHSQGQKLRFFRLNLFRTPRGLPEV